MGKTRIVGWVALGLVVALAMIAAGLALRWALASPTGAVEQREIVLGGEYRIQFYDQFHDLHQEIKAKQARLALYGDDLDQREATGCRGLFADLTETVADYNSASLAYRTRGQWRDPALPQTVPQPEVSPCGN